MELQFLVTEMLQEAQKKHGRTFNSKAEAYAVLKEEIEESREEVENLEGALNKFWRDIRGNNVEPIDVKAIKMYAMNLVQESLQVAAMCDKYFESFEEEKEYHDKKSDLTCDNCSHSMISKDENLACTYFKWELVPGKRFCLNHKMKIGFKEE